MAQSELAGPRILRRGERLGSAARLAGSGGDAEVYRGELDGVSVALKVGRGSAERLAREAEVLALASSTGMPALLSVGWVKREQDQWWVVERGPEARPCLVLDWRPHHEADASVTRTLALARDVGGALADAHALGIAHGDVKRDNVVISRAGRATLLDWGLACPVHQRELTGATPRYLATSDADLGDARARDLLAFGVLLAEELIPSSRGALDAVARARRVSTSAPLDGLLAALLAPAPAARPSARWAEELAAAAVGASKEELADRRVRHVRATYLRVRRDALRGVAPAGAPRWLDMASRWLRAIADLERGDGGDDAEDMQVLPYLNIEQIGRWLVSLVGPHAASWPCGPFADAGEARLVEGLALLARDAAPSGWTLHDVERAVVGGASAPSRRARPEDAVERAARLVAELGETPPRWSAIEAVERDEAAPPTLVREAANALRLRAELGRARALTLRGSAKKADAGALLAEISRRAGDVDEAAARAKAALVDDPDGRARAVLARLAFDAGDAEGALSVVGDATGAACAEVAALALAQRSQTKTALAALERGEAYARSSEDRARLAGTRGYVLAAVAPAAALEAYRSAVDHAVRAGMVAEEASYRTGEAAAAVDEGYLGEGIATGARAALLWEALGRPALAARATLAVAAAHATLGATAEARTAAARAAALARESGDFRACAYAWMALADASRSGSVEGRDAAEAAAASLADRPATSEDVLRAAARMLEQGLSTARSVDELDALAEKALVTASARLDWWGARASALFREGSAGGARVGEGAVLAALVGLATAPAPMSSRGPALDAGLRLAIDRGRSDVAERLRGPLRDAARTLMARVGPDLAAKAAHVGWVVANLASDGASMDAEQVRELEHLVRSLGTGERLGSLLRRVLDALVLWTGVERGLLLLRAPDGRLVPRAARNFARDDLRGEQATLSQSLARRAIEALEPVVAVDAAGELPPFHDSVHALRLRSVLAVPLVARGEALGVAYLDDRIRRGAFGPRELAWTRTIAALASSMIADARDQVLLRRAVRAARRSNERLAESLADREAKLEAAERTLEMHGSPTARRHPEIVGESEAMQRLLRTVDRVAASDVPVLVVGESGSGKELVARAIHATGARATRAFVSENCGAIPEGLLESALFGHVRGAFTGADRTRSGLFEAADGGTLFLDEVGEMSLGMQAKLLRVLEDGLVRPLGTERSRKVDVRVITATHRDLEAMVRERRFREDLYYRLNIITLRVPPLRDRAADIPLLVRRFVEKHAGGRRVSVSRAAMQRLSAFSWPGNVRQLENEVRRALVLADDVIDRDHLTPDIDGGANGALAEAGLNVRMRVDLLETALVKDALERTKGNQTQAAKLLGLSRFGLQKMMKRLAIALPG